MVLPGLIDMHTHLVDQEQTENIAEPLLTTAAYQAYIGAAHARSTLMAGFTSVRDVGTWRAFGDVALRDAIDKPASCPGPRMSVAGAYITIPGGGGEITGIAADVKHPRRDAGAAWSRTPPTPTARRPTSWPTTPTS
jgi:imidazolonepropionase-like amidohydrolase